MTEQEEVEAVSVGGEDITEAVKEPASEAFMIVREYEDRAERAQTALQATRIFVQNLREHDLTGVFDPNQLERLLGTAINSVNASTFAFEAACRVYNATEEQHRG